MRTLAGRYPEDRIRPENGPGCTALPSLRPVDCEVSFFGRAGTLEATMLDPPDNRSGRYVPTLSGTGRVGSSADGPRVPFPPGRLTGPLPPTRVVRPALRAGQPLAPDAVGDRQRVLRGSPVVVHFGIGSVTGGFDVLLQVDPRRRP